ncbi:MAG: LexA family protein [Gammaproteobacteria bacterium]
MTRGGARVGAGRPKGRGPHGEATKPLRIPLSMVAEVVDYVSHKGYQLPLYGSKVQAGFPSPADDFMEGKLDLNQYLIKRPAATFLVRATGDSMINAGIHEGDLLVVDRSLEAVDGKVVIAALDGYLTVKRLSIQQNKMWLLPENDKFAPIAVNPETDAYIWGVVTNVIHGV